MNSITDQQLLEQYLAEHDEPCPSCGYNLRQLKGTTCPECGDLLRLRVGLERPQRAAFITGIVGLAASMGFSGLLLVYFVYIVAWVGRRGGLDMKFVTVTGSEFIVSAALFTIWLCMARRIRRLSAPARWTLALMCAAVPFVTLAIFSANIR